MSPTETDDLAARLTPEALRQQLDWHKERIASKPWFKDGILDKPEACISCHFMVALIEKALGADALDRRPAPKVGMIGHVDSGKTSLAAAVTRALDASPSPALEAVAVKPLEKAIRSGFSHWLDLDTAERTVDFLVHDIMHFVNRDALTHPPALVEALKEAREAFLKVGRYMHSQNDSNVLLGLVDVQVAKLDAIITGVRP